MTLQGGKVRVQVKANPDGESFVIFNNGEAECVDGLSGAYVRTLASLVCLKPKGRALSLSRAWLHVWTDRPAPRLTRPAAAFYPPPPHPNTHRH